MSGEKCRCVSKTHYVNDSTHFDYIVLNSRLVSGPGVVACSYNPSSWVGGRGMWTTAGSEVDPVLVCNGPHGHHWAYWGLVSRKKVLCGQSGRSGEWKCIHSHRWTISFCCFLNFIFLFLIHVWGESFALVIFISIMYYFFVFCLYFSFLTR